MNKIVIPSILVGTILIAGIFAFMPVQKAVTVHDEILDAINGNFDGVFTDLSGIHDWITGGHATLTGQHHFITGNLDGLHDWVTGGHTTLTGQHRDFFNAVCDLLGGSTIPGPGFSCFTLL